MVTRRKADFVSNKNGLERKLASVRVEFEEWRADKGHFGSRRRGELPMVSGRNVTVSRKCKTTLQPSGGKRGRERHSFQPSDPSLSGHPDPHANGRSEGTRTGVLD